MIRITEVTVEHYRSIRSLSFQPSMLTAIVGANNAGKSNIFSALDFLLGPRWPTEQSLSSDDYYRGDETRHPFVQATLEATTERDVVRHSFQVGVESDEGFKLRHRLGSGGWTWANRDLRDRFPLVTLGVDRATRSYQPTNRWTLLGRLLLQVNNALRDDEERMELFRVTMESLRTDVLASVPEFEDLINIVQQETARQLQKSVEDVDVQFQLHDPWNFYRTLQLVVREYGITVRADQAGMGLQSTLAIAILRAYARIARANRAIIAVEEPELYLHPLAQRQFYRLLRTLAYPEDGGDPLQILYTTHSSNFVALEHFDEVCVVSRTESESLWSSSVRQFGYPGLIDSISNAGFAATSESTRGRIQAIDVGSSADALFANAVVLVEGQSEEMSLGIYAAALGCDFDAIGVAVVGAGRQG